MPASRLVLASCALTALVAGNADDWSGVEAVLTSGVSSHAFPSAVALVGDVHGELWSTAAGKYTYDAGSEAVTKDTVFDMASCTKVLSTTTMLAQFVDRGEVALDTPVASAELLGPDFAANGKSGVTVRHCLLHNTGYPPDPTPGYWTPHFGCPETLASRSPAEAFTCAGQVYSSLLGQVLDRPIGTSYVYSDLSFITLMFVVGHLSETHNYTSPADMLPQCREALSRPANGGGRGSATADNADNAGLRKQCHFEAYFRKHVAAPLGLSPSTGFLPAAVPPSACTPEWNDTVYRHKQMRGQVSDENAYAMGGVSGHAGLFSTVKDVEAIVRAWMFPSSPGGSPTPPLLSREVVKLFSTEANHSQSSRALGWNTNDYSVFDRGWNQSCGYLSPETYTHVGYTGTQVCLDPQRGLYTILLTNRVYPDRKDIQIRHVRLMFNEAVRKIVDGPGRGA